MHSLIVDDVRANCRALEALLTPFGPCEMAHNGRDAIDLFQYAWETKEPYDLICLDLVMPDIDRYWAADKFFQSRSASGTILKARSTLADLPPTSHRSLSLPIAASGGSIGTKPVPLST